ncbi:hypothetical protein ABH991_006544 [Bradyrhizobium ottawaense]|jgi:hypothetical protein|uniref:Uncharacterized protein n=1 Tax=Bradyrhizobium ottawaense TaxID=931866 RepID=A0ABV4FXP4_9BRAD
MTGRATVSHAQRGTNGVVTAVLVVVGGEHTLAPGDQVKPSADGEVVWS